MNEKVRSTKETCGPESPELAELDILIGTVNRVVSSLFADGGDGCTEMPGGLRGYQILRMSACGSSSSQGTISRRLGIDKTVLVYLLDQLEASGLIRRVPDPRDRRSRMIQLTTEGMERVATLRRITEPRVDALLVTLSNDERAALMSGLLKLSESPPAALDT